MKRKQYKLQTFDKLSLRRVVKILMMANFDSSSG